MVPGEATFLAIMKFKKSVPSDKGRQRQAALIALAVYSELKHVILVDEDVDIFDTNEVLWAIPPVTRGTSVRCLSREFRLHCALSSEGTVRPSQIQRHRRGRHQALSDALFKANGALSDAESLRPEPYQRAHNIQLIQFR